MKKLFLAITLVFVVCLLCVSASAAVYDGTADTSWYNNNDLEFTLDTPEELAGLAKLVNEGNDFADKTVKLGADMILNEGDYLDWAESAPANEWTPIGCYRDSAFVLFKGIFDGQGHTVSGMYIDASGTSLRPGLFGCVGGGAEIKNLKLTNSYVIAGTSNGTALVAAQHSVSPTLLFKNIEVTKSAIDARNNGGGTAAIMGRTGSMSKGITFENCKVDAEIKNAGNYTAGLLGFQSGTSLPPDITVRGCEVDIDISGDGEGMGALIGVSPAKSTVTVEYSAARGTINNANERSGGMVGAFTNNDCAELVIRESVSDVDITGSTCVGGLVGELAHNDVCVIVDNVAVLGTLKTTALDGSEKYIGAVAGKVGNSDFSYVSHTYNNVYNATGEKIGVYLYNKTMIVGSQLVEDKERFTAGLDSDVWDTEYLTLKASPLSRLDYWDGSADTSWYNSADAVFTLTNAEQLAGLAELVNEGNDFEGKTVKLGTNVVLNCGSYLSWGIEAPTYRWTPIGNYTTEFFSFKGTFDGQGNTVWGMYVNTNGTSDRAGFFGCIGGSAAIKDLYLKNSYVKASSLQGDNGYVSNGNGIIVGQTAASDHSILFENVSALCFVMNANYNPGGVAAIVGRTGTVKGGITFDGCTVKGYVEHGDGRVGGLVGYQSGTIPTMNVSDCLVEMNVNARGTYEVGIGMILGNCTKKIDVNIERTTVVGNINTTSIRAGGMVGALTANGNATLTVRDSVSDVKVSGYGSVGGIIGETPHNDVKITLENVAVYGDVTASSTEDEYKNYYGAIIGKCGNSSVNIPTHTYTNVYVPTGTKTGEYLYSGTLTSTSGVVSDKENFVKTLDTTLWNTEIERPSLHTYSLVQESQSTIGGKCGEELTWELDLETGVLTISGTGAMSDWIIFETPWNSYRADIKRVVVSEGVTTVGEYAFYDFSNLTSVNLPSTLISIKSFAFYGASKLKTINLPENLEEICDGAFSYSGLTSVHIPKGLKKVGDAFTGSIPNSGFTVDEENTYFTSIDGVLFSYDKTVLYSYPRLRSADSYTVPKTVKTIGKRAFESAFYLTEIVLPEGLETIEEYAFCVAMKLSEIAIPNGVTKLNNGLFWQCKALEKVTLPGTLEAILDSVFYSCNNLALIRYMGNEIGWNDIDKSQSWDNTLTDYRLVFDLSVTYGDATGDGIVDNKDLVRIKKYIAGLDFDTGVSTEEVSAGADATGDGAVDNKDLVRLKKYLAAYDYDTGTSGVILGPNT